MGAQQLINTPLGRMTPAAYAMFTRSGISPAAPTDKYGLSIKSTGNGSLFSMPGNGGIGSGTAGSNANGPGMPALAKNLAPDNAAKTAGKKVAGAAGGIWGDITSVVGVWGLTAVFVVLGAILIVLGLARNGVHPPATVLR